MRTGYSLCVRSTHPPSVLLVMWVLVALVPPLGHAVWALARSAGEADGASPLQIALAAALLELAIFFGLVAAVVAAARR